MKKLLVFTLFLATSFNYFAQEKYSKVKIYATNTELGQIANLGIAVDHGQRKNDTWLITDISQSQIETLQNNGFDLDIEIDDVTQYYIQRNLDADTKDDDRADCGQAENSGFTPVTPTNLISEAGLS